MKDLLLGFHVDVKTFKSSLSNFAKEKRDSVRDSYFSLFFMIKDLSKLAGEDDTDDIEA